MHHSRSGSQAQHLAMTLRELTMIVNCAKHFVVRIGRKHPISDYVEIVSQRRTDARERKLKNRKLRTAPDVGRKYLFIVKVIASHATISNIGRQDM
jgi:hypothetical protein